MRLGSGSRYEINRQVLFLEILSITIRGGLTVNQGPVFDRFLLIVPASVRQTVVISRVSVYRRNRQKIYLKSSKFSKM